MLVFATNGVWVIAVKYLADGRLVITRGETYEILDEDGNVLEEHKLEGYGWKRPAECPEHRFGGRRRSSCGS